MVVLTVRKHHGQFGVVQHDGITEQVFGSGFVRVFGKGEGRDYGRNKGSGARKRKRAGTRV